MKWELSFLPPHSLAFPRLLFPVILSARDAGEAIEAGNLPLFSNTSLSLKSLSF